jgi:hypothetical protein
MAAERHDAGAHAATVGVVVDGEASPAEFGRHLEAVLPQLLARRFGDGRTWHVVVRCERLPAGRLGTHDTLIRHAAEQRLEECWDAVLCVTDLPLTGQGDRPLIADLAAQHGVVVISLPAFGVTRLRRRVTAVALELLNELLGEGRDGRPADHQPVPSIQGRLRGPFRVITPAGEGIDVQVVASRGGWRQLVGMVRANRPWRLALGLRGALVGALALSAFWLINPSTWQLGNAHGFPRLLLISLATVAAVMVWLITYHHLWERVGDAVADRRLVLLFNASTVLTLLIGVGTAYVGLFVLNLLTARLVIADELLGRQLQGPAGWTEYVKLTWMATAGACIAGALGTGFDSEESVRQAAYSQREAERRRQWRERSRNKGGEGNDA